VDYAKLQVNPRQIGYILVVDDNASIRESFRALLETWGYNVKTADGGQEALDIARLNYPAVAFIDLNMPEMDGYELAAQLRRFDGHDALLFAVSAWISERAENKLFDDVFEKPINLELVWKLLSALPAA